MFVKEHQFRYYNTFGGYTILTLFVGSAFVNIIILSLPSS